MRLLRSTAYNMIMYGSGLVLSLYCLLVARFLPGGLLKIARLWGRVCLWGLRVCCGITVEVEGLEHLPQGGVVIAAQHQSAVDALIWLTILQQPVFVFKKELQRLPLFGALLEPAGMIKVNRGGGGQALREMVTGAGLALARGGQVVLFPEGTRVAYGKRGQIRHGIVALAQSAHVPVLPAATNTGLRWGRKVFAKSPGPVRVIIHPGLQAGLSREEILARLEEVFYGAESLKPLPGMQPDAVTPAPPMD